MGQAWNVKSWSYKMPPVSGSKAPGVHEGVETKIILIDLEKKYKQNRKIILLLLRWVSA
jgi:hypothetical protein